MTNKVGLAHVKSRLIQAPDLAALRATYERFGKDYRSHPEIVALKDRLKAAFERGVKA